MSSPKNTVWRISAKPVASAENARTHADSERCFGATALAARIASGPKSPAPSADGSPLKITASAAMRVPSASSTPDARPPSAMIRVTRALQRRSAPRRHIPPATVQTPAASERQTSINSAGDSMGEPPT